MKTVMVLLGIGAAGVHGWFKTRAGQNARRAALQACFHGRPRLSAAELHERHYAARGIERPIVARVRAILEDELDADLAQLLPFDDFDGPLSALFEGGDDEAVVPELERAFGIAITDAEAEACRRFDDIVVLIQRKLQSRAGTPPATSDARNHMNKTRLSAGLLAALTALIHTFAGTAEIHAPLLGSALDLPLKLLLYACWHMVTLLLILSAAALLHAARPAAGPGAAALTRFIALLWLLSGLVFLAVAFAFAGAPAALDLPQWTLLLPTGALGWWSARPRRAASSARTT